MGGIFGADKAADAAKDASKRATKAQMEMFNRAMAMLQPYVDFGQRGMAAFEEQLPYLSSRFEPTMEQLEKTPGYQFALQQGLKGTQNSYAAKGLGVSGAALKGASDYATGLASQTYQQQFQNDLAQKSQIYNMLFNPVQLGAGAAAGGANMTNNVGTNLANIQMQRGQQEANAYGQMGAGIDSLFGTALGLFGL